MRILHWCFILLSITKLSATDYNIGPGQTYESINAFSVAVGFQNLQPGDNVYIHYRSTPYREFIFINTSGISIIGVPSIGGALPVLDGSNAVQSAFNWQDVNNFYTQTDGVGDPNPLNPNIYTYYAGGLYNYGLITIGRAAGSSYTAVPVGITIENLEIRNAHESQQFTPWFSGLVSPSHPYAATYNSTSRSYEGFIAGIRVQRGEDITIRNCHIHDCGNGIFVNSVVDDNNGNGTFDAGDASLISRNILIERNSIHDNGCSTGNSCHNVYCEASGITYQYNYFGGKKSGANDSNCLKDRSAGTVIRYNYFDAIDQGHILDLVEAEASAPLMINEPDYHSTNVYGNVLMNPPSGPTTPIHYGGDHCEYSIYRRGSLNFFNNTLINKANQSDRYRTSLFFLPVSDYFNGPPYCSTAPASFVESVNASNNIIYNVAGTTGGTPSETYLLQSDLNSTHSFTNNFISQGITNGFSGVWDFANSVYKPFIATVNRVNTLSPAANNPGFVNYAANDFHLSSSSVCVNYGNHLLNSNTVDLQYVNHQGYESRSQTGNIDLGAYENTESLPVNWLDITAVVKNEHTLLLWEVANELNCDGYDIQRSQNGVVFEKIGMVDCSNAGKYIFWDRGPAIGRNYYRIVQRDTDGRSSISIVRSVDIGSATLRAFPNPVNEILTVEGAFEEGQSYRIINQLGQVVQEGMIPNNYQIIVANLKNGVYYLKTGTQVVRFVKGGN